MSTERNLTHEEVFGHLEDKVLNVAEVFAYLDDVDLFLRFMSYRTRGWLTKKFPPVTLEELRQWKKGNRDDKDS